MSNLHWLDVESLQEERVLDLQFQSSPPLLLEQLDLIGKLEKFPNWISSLCNLKRIYLRGCRLKDNPLEVLQALPNLVYLKLQGAYDGEELCFNAGGFPTLKILHLSNFERLELAKVEEGAMPHLVELIFDEYTMLKKHFHGQAQHLLRFADPGNRLSLRFARKNRRRTEWRGPGKTALESISFIASSLNILPEPFDLVVREFCGGNGGGFGFSNSCGETIVVEPGKKIIVKSYARSSQSLHSSG
ncbi:hypothetical protein HHK36_020323 [Tetracentron sinense]|uniref:Disease resistance R13L4/SHOC-2-like LRR domain-containing protein n=1 Tax=Tetracentron sinense TaxID=13715 RepID=A0A834YX97_TETSI|nr:hypothetical protein HHK36_020323 [Tetracentron sinense]